MGKYNLIFTILFLLLSSVECASAVIDTTWNYSAIMSIENNTVDGATLIYNFTYGDFPTMKSDWTDINFEYADGEDAPYYIISKSDGEWANIAIKTRLNDLNVTRMWGNGSYKSKSNISSAYWFGENWENTPNERTLIFDDIRLAPWEPCPTNPIMTKSTTGWDSWGIRDPELLTWANGSLVIEDGNYVMYYSGYEYAEPHYYRAIGRATSNNETNWTKYPTPVLSNGSSGSWDYFGTQAGNVIKRGENDYYMVYSGVGDWDSWGVGVATSTDGIHFTKATAPVLMNSDFNLSGNNILTFPHVTILSNGFYILAMGGTETVDGFSIYEAISTDNGSTYTPLNDGEPTLRPTAGEWDDDNIEGPIIIEMGQNKYLMTYHGNNNHPDYTEHQLGIAYSTDLIHWTKYNENPIMQPSEAWCGHRVESMFLAIDDIRNHNDTLRMWYSGTPSTNGEQNSAFGYATCNQSVFNYHFSKWYTSGNLTNTTICENGNTYASITGTSTHSAGLISIADGFDNFVFHADVKPSIDNGTACNPYVNFRYINMSNRYITLLRGEPTNDIFLRRIQGNTNYISTGYSFDYTPTWYNYTVVFNNTKIDAYLDGVHVIDYNDTTSSITSGKIGIYEYFLNNSAYFDNITIKKISPISLTNIGDKTCDVDFSSSRTTGVIPLTVSFANTSSNADLYWDFENDGIIDSTKRNPVHTYGKAGNYAVNLTVQNEYGNFSTVKTDYITVSNPSLSDPSSLFWWLWGYITGGV